MKTNDKKYYIFEMDINILNIISFILLGFMVILTCLLVGYKAFTNIDYILVLFIYVFWMILHEILHGFSYVLYGAKFKNITFGINLEKGVLCCLCKQNIRKKTILISLVHPFIFIGILTYIISIIFNLKILLLLSICNIAGCSGDLIMFYSLARLKNFEFSEYDNPIGFGLYSKEDLSKRKMFGLKYIETKDKLQKEDLKKLNVSKKSIGIIIAFFIFMILSILIKKL